MCQREGRSREPWPWRWPSAPPAPQRVLDPNSSPHPPPRDEVRLHVHTHWPPTHIASSRAARVPKRSKMHPVGKVMKLFMKEPMVKMSENCSSCSLQPGGSAHVMGCPGGGDAAPSPTNSSPMPKPRPSRP